MLAVGATVVRDFHEVPQKHMWGCGIACVASRLGISYEYAKERLEKIPAILKRFRQSVLTAAVTGKLTEKWREEHPDVECAEVGFRKNTNMKNEQQI